MKSAIGKTMDTRVWGKAISDKQSEFLEYPRIKMRCENMKSTRRIDGW